MNDDPVPRGTGSSRVPPFDRRRHLPVVELQRAARERQGGRGPTVKSTARQILEALPWSGSPKYLLRDGAGDYGVEYRRFVQSLGIRDLVTSPGTPWQNGYVERVIGSIRREASIT